MLRAVGILLLLPLLPFQQILHAQIEVSLRVTEETGGIFESNFRQALNNLDDVTVVGPEERGDYILRVVVLCEGISCRNPMIYYLSIALAEPIADNVVANWLRFAAEISLPDSTNAALNQALRGYEIHHAAWVTSWGRDRYEQAIREFVAVLDSQCFEKGRVLRRALDTPGDEGDRLMERWGSDEWLC